VVPIRYTVRPFTYCSISMRLLLLVSISFGLFSSALFANSLAKEPMVIGIDADFSAVAIDGGIAIRRGAELAVDSINQSGGLLGRQLSIVAKDHRGNPARGIHNINSFAAIDNLIAVIGGVHTPVALAELDAIHENNLLYLGPWAAGTPLVDNGFSPNNVFRVSLRDAEAGKVLISYAKERGFRRVTLVLERTGWGRSNESSLIQAAEHAGITIDAIHWINWQQKSFEEDLKLIQASNTDGIVLVANAPEGAVVVNGMVKLDMLSLPIISHWGIASGSFLDRIATTPDKLDISVLQTFHFKHNITPEAVALFEAYKARYGATDQNSVTAAVGVAHAYDLVQLLALAIKSANSFNIDDVRNALENIESYNGVVKRYEHPFSSSQRDALLSNDYFMASFDASGNIIVSEPD